MFVPLAFLKKWRDRALGVTRGGLDTEVPLTDDEVRAVWMCSSWLIGYPDEELVERLDLIEELAAGLPGPVDEDLLSVVSRLRAGDAMETRAEYVDTFDTRRRGCLYLTYFTNGDTRKRGTALLDIKQAYREAGLEVSDAELPDHLSYVLEFGAAHDIRRGVSILLRNRAGIELLRLHLGEIDSPWAGAIRAVCRTLPALDGDDITAVKRLAADGPEEELVGVSGLGDGLGGYGDGSEDMPPADMTPYAVPPAGPGVAAPVGVTSSAGGTAFIPLSDVHTSQRRERTDR